MVVIIIKKSRLAYFIIAFVILLALPLCIFLNNNGLPMQAAKYEAMYNITIDVQENKLYLYKNNICIKKYPVASGKIDWPSPIGEWTIIDKGKWGEAFGGWWLGLDVPWGIYGIHGTTNESSIGKAASHGCIRMYNKDIEELYNFVPNGTKVIIKNGKYGPFGKSFRDLKPGDIGSDVLAVQKRLKMLGYFTGYESGRYDDDLKIALFNFQKDKNIPVKNIITIQDYNAMGF